MRAAVASLPWTKRIGLDADAAVPALAVALGYYLATRLGFAFTLQPYPISVLWPANALLMAGLLLIAPRRWWLVVAAALPAHLLAQLQSEVPLAMVLGLVREQLQRRIQESGTFKLCRRFGVSTELP